MHLETPTQVAWPHAPTPPPSRDRKESSHWPEKKNRREPSLNKSVILIFNTLNKT